MRISSNLDRHIDISRDDKSRIISATDDTGRTVSFEYNERGLLTTFVDLAGGKWHYKYNKEGLLQGAQDPRGVHSINAVYDNKRVKNIKVHHESLTFERSRRDTVKMTNSLNETGTFWHNPSGLTTSIMDFSGDTTSLTFDRQLRVVDLSYKGQKVVVVDYDSNNQIQTLTRLYSDSQEKRSFEYDHGRLKKISIGDLKVAEYNYDSKGNLNSATDGLGSRKYEYRRNGHLKSILANGNSYYFQTSSIGQIENISKENSSVARLSYNSDSTVGGVSIALDDQSTLTDFAYNRRGLRTTANYSDAVSTEISYDAVGNLISLQQESTNAKTEDRYSLGDDNEILRISSSLNPDMTIGYNLLGDLQTLSQGKNYLVVDYDKLGRMKTVDINGERVIDVDYSPMDADAVTVKDDRTKATFVNAPYSSPVFGSLDSIIYTRPVGSPYGPIRFDPDLSRFVIDDNVPRPDSILWSSLRRRMMIPSDLSIDPNPLAFDKPSNSLFIPPEMASVNCLVCVSDANDFELTVNGQSNTKIMKNVSATFRPHADDDYCVDATIGDGFILRTWYTSVNFGDNSSAGTWTSNTNATFNHAYSFRGTYNASANIFCTCRGSGTPFSAFDSATVTVCTQPTTYAQVTSCPSALGQNDDNITIDGCTTPVGPIQNPGASLTLQKNPPGTAFGSNQVSVPPSGAGLVNLPCNKHDFCYGTCGANKASCDSAFGTGTVQVCEAAFSVLCPYEGTVCNDYWAQLGECINTANSWTLSLVVFGGTLYKAAQVEGCECCGE